MKTLVIHPADPTTSFLSVIYADQPRWSVINNRPSDSRIRELIKSHDRIILLGHGTVEGLLSADQRSLIVNSRHVQELRNKQYVIAIWCYASTFMRKYELTGFATGMFVSEPHEANTNDLLHYPREIVESNDMFAIDVSIQLQFQDCVQIDKFDKYAKLYSNIACFNRSKFYAKFANEFDITHGCINYSQGYSRCNVQCAKCSNI